MSTDRPSWKGVTWLLGLCLLTFGPGLGSAVRLTYHEAFVAEGAREIVVSGNWLYPSIGGLPWLEKPPLPFWLVAGLGWMAGDVTPLLARIPFALAAVAVGVGVALLASRHQGRAIGILSGAIQVTTAWTVLRGRLAEADVLLAALITWTLLAFDRLRTTGHEPGQGPPWRFWRWVFFGLLGLCSLVKGTGFGAALVVSVIAAVLAWDRDREGARRLAWPVGWGLAAGVTFAWPLAMIAVHGRGALALWLMHIVRRLGHTAGHGPFAGEPLWEYVTNLIGQALPWTPMAAVGAWYSLRRLGASGRQLHGLTEAAAAGDRLLWVWSVVPLLLVSLPSARNAHYAIHAMVPWSVWAAQEVVKLGSRLRARGWPTRTIQRGTAWGLTALAVAYGLGFAWLGPLLDRRGVEWAFYEAAGQRLAADESLVLVYDDWDREPYPTPFGPIPHDLAVRLFYLNRAVTWRRVDEVENDLHHQASRNSMAVIARPRDLSRLAEAARIEVLSTSPPVRWDRAYALARVHPAPAPPEEGPLTTRLAGPSRR